MRKSLSFMLAIAVIATMVVLSAEGYAWGPRWRMYDSFNSGVIDPDRWDIDDSSARISIENGKARFEHESGHPGDSAWLIIKQAPERVRGIRVTMTVESCTGDVRARTGGFIGRVGDDYLFEQLGLEGSITSPRIFGNLAVLEPVNLQYLYDLFYAQYIRPLDIVGNTFTITMIFSGREVTYEVSGLGKIIHVLSENISPTDNHLKGIGTRSTNGEGPCVVYFDNVYVLR